MTTVLATKAPLKQKQSDTGTGRGFGCRTVLFNDDIHTFDQVAYQLMKAINCTFTKGMELATVVDRAGSAVVYSGHLERCEAVAMVLEEIRLRVNVER
jgi:hypothetical protein